ncbi:MAG: heme ABC transporter ATP-binding protein [Micrococcales bacterium]|nr:heme ABC transporter ATP-binding protein [Micrococcales bacterium]
MNGVLATQAVTYRVDNFTVLDGVDLEIKPGQVTVVVGPNGAGKSTLLSLLAGDLTPSGGQVTYDGRPIGEYSVTKLARLRAVMAQENVVAFPFTVLDIVRMGRAPWHGTDQAEMDDAEVALAMARTDTSSLAERRFPTLSGGEKARVAFGRTLVQRGRVLLLDEPTAALDIRHQEMVMALARGEAAGGGAVAAVVHDLSLAAAWADQVVLLDRGKLAGCGTAEQVLTAESLSNVYQHKVDVLDHPQTGVRMVVPRRGTV